PLVAARAAGVQGDHLARRRGQLVLLHPLAGDLHVEAALGVRLLVAAVLAVVLAVLAAVLLHRLDHLAHLGLELEVVVVAVLGDLLEVANRLLVAQLLHLFVGAGGVIATLFLGADSLHQRQRLGVDRVFGEHLVAVVFGLVPVGVVALGR